jgi:hypothetical protein
VFTKLKVQALCMPKQHVLVQCTREITGSYCTASLGMCVDQIEEYAYICDQEVSEPGLVADCDMHAYVLHVHHHCSTGGRSCCGASTTPAEQYGKQPWKHGHRHSVAHMRHKLTHTLLSPMPCSALHMRNLQMNPGTTEWVLALSMPRKISSCSIAGLAGLAGVQRPLKTQCCYLHCQTNADHVILRLTLSDGTWDKVG